MSIGRREHFGLQRTLSLVNVLPIAQITGLWNIMGYWQSNDGLKCQEEQTLSKTVNLKNLKIVILQIMEQIIELSIYFRKSDQQTELLPFPRRVEFLLELLRNGISCVRMFLCMFLVTGLPGVERHNDEIQGQFDVSLRLSFSSRCLYVKNFTSAYLTLFIYKTGELQDHMCSDPPVLWQDNSTGSELLLLLCLHTYCVFISLSSLESFCCHFTFVQDCPFLEIQTL